MRSRLVLFTIFVQLVCTGIALGDEKVNIETTNGPGTFPFATIQPPALNDAGTQGKWSIAVGKADANSAALSALHDGRAPEGDDEPAENFFFAAGSAGGTIIVDLGSAQVIEEIVTYSRHASTRGPQLFTVWTAKGNEPGFSSTVDVKADPEKNGWKKLAKVDSREAKPDGSQHAASITSDNKQLAQARYVRFDVSATEHRDPFGNTFLSEIDILTQGGPAIKRLAPPERQELAFESADGRFKYVIDTTIAPDLKEWSEKELKPVIEKWYPKIVDMLPSEGFEAPKQVRFQYLPADKMNGIPAWAQNATVSMNAGWFRGELKREARGAVVHEMVHVVQDYQRWGGRGRRGPPGWIVEGIPDYIRWFLYEPESRGALLSKKALANAKHDASYRTTGNFIDWVVRTQDGGGDLLQRLNAAARHGKYSSDVWKELTGKTEGELAEAWRGQ